MTSDRYVSETPVRRLRPSNRRAAVIACPSPGEAGSAVRRGLLFTGLILRCLITAAVLAGLSQAGTAGEPAAVEAPQEPVNPQLKAMTYRTSLDHSEQPMRVWAPETAKTRPTPLYVHLHSWSGNYLQPNDAWFRLAAARGWIILHPNFRGPNRQPEACGSPLARQDVLDAIDWAIGEYQVDQSRIYLAGASGGGHMSMLMAAYYPERFSAVSAWVGISDLAEWYRFHTPEGKPGNYAQMTAASCGGAPGTSPEVDAEYKARSPLFHIHRAVGLPLELSAGVNDGHTGSVPVRHTLNAFNALAQAQNAETVSEEEMEQISTDRKLAKPQPGDLAPDDAYGRDILLRRTAGKAQVTIFDGGHEGLPQAGIAFLARHRRMTRAPAADKPAAD